MHNTQPSKKANPFPAEAVATFGAALQTCPTLHYMLTIRRHLDDYLKAYALEPSGAGASVSIAGSHGSGKTHVLGWLAQLLAENRSIRGTSVYVKCDSSSFSDLYTQIIYQISRDQLIELIQLALLDLARKKVQAAKLTESVAERLESPGALLLLDSEKNIDLEQLRQELIDDLERNAGVSRDMVRALLDLPSATLGSDAYGWLTGRPNSDLLALGITTPIVPSDRSNQADSDLAAISALELIAALHRSARVPMMVLVDQLEIFLRVKTSDDLVSLGSL